ncbi:fibronectin type III domain-containing protein [Flagellimonas sp.]|uniref:fibronectin type III domain-containing protein n=1 Tax=Flagellimonas sp. TaxID=2058762 RepID=UPI003B5B43DC
MKNLSLFGLVWALFFVCSFLNAQEIHTQANAASINNEANATDGWTGSTVNTVVTDQVFSGSYAIKLEAATDGWARAEYTFTTIPGEKYKITIHAKSGTPVRQGFYQWDGFTDFVAVDNIVQEWTKYTWTLTASNTSALIKIFTGHPSIAGDAIYIDNISIVKEDLQAPSAPSLSSISQSDITVDLSWSGATDNVGVTGYKIFKDNNLEATLGNVTSYQVTGLTASTNYSFMVTALDAAGNESSASNSISVTTDASSGGGGGSGSSIWSEAGSVASYIGNVAIGTSSVPSGYKMAVDGKLITEEIKVQLSGNWPDYVFKKGYDLPTLEEIQKHIDEKGHLPNIPSANEVEANGIELGEMNKLLLEKIEQLTLYILKQQKEIDQLKNLVKNIK